MESEHPTGPSMTEPFNATEQSGSGEAVGQCLYCGYDLSGLPGDTRCPECGRQSIPEAFRREVQEIFDSPRRLYCEALRFHTKHPPGWYWSLDRPGDVRRSFGLAIINVVLCFAILFFATMLANVYVLRTSIDQYYIDPTGEQPDMYAGRFIYDHGVFGVLLDYKRERSDQSRETPIDKSNLQYKATTTTRLYCRGFCMDGWEIHLGSTIGLTMIWIVLTQVGLWTQIRRGLPKFARARRTIIAACNCETCKLPFQALLIVVCMAFSTAILLGFPEASFKANDTVMRLLVPLIVILIYASWIGPLRSDFTRQLIRSRRHAIRMFVMYVLLFPLPLTAIPMMVIEVMTRGW